ncbi:MAG: PorT family protein [Muribaculaceae bacterium]|nr:PorT family protein [Muribaculaceae bacterium]
MKRLILTIALVLGITAGAHSQFRWGASVGGNYNDLNFKQDLISIGASWGGSAGIRAEMMFPGIGFGIDLGLLYSNRATEVNLGERLIWSSQGYGNERIMTHNIDIPVNLKFKWTRMQGVEDYVAPFVYGGPVLSIQAGHSKCDAMKFSGGEVGLTAGLGVEIFKRWQVAASYTWGMTYAMKTRLLDDFSARNKTWDLHVTYFF